MKPTYHYQLSITGRAAIAEIGFLAEKIPNNSYITIHSEEFDTFSACEKKLSSLLVIIGNKEGALTRSTFSPIIKTNPNLMEENDLEIIDSTWEDDKLVMKIYLVNKTELTHKASKLTYYISGWIYSSMEI